MQNYFISCECHTNFKYQLNTHCKIEFYFMDYFINHTIIFVLKEFNFKIKTPNRIGFIENPTEKSKNDEHIDLKCAIE